MEETFKHIIQIRYSKILIFLGWFGNGVWELDYKSIEDITINVFLSIIMIENLHKPQSYLNEILLRSLMLPLMIKYPSKH